MTKIARTLVYLPAKILRLALIAIKNLRSDPRKLLAFMCLVGVVALSRALVNRATMKRIQAQKRQESQDNFQSLFGRLTRTSSDQNISDLLQGNKLALLEGQTD